MVQEFDLPALSDTRQDLSLRPFMPFAERGFARSWTADDLKLSLLTRAWKIVISVTG